MILGFSILVASISFLCYRHPPSSWGCLTWLRRPSVQHGAKQPGPPPSAALKNEKPKAELEKHHVVEKSDIPITSTGEPLSHNVKAEQDRKAMPPPPFFKKPALPQTRPIPSPSPSRPLRDPSIPSFTLETHDGKDKAEDSIPVPSFPALNSAQRASGGVRDPPRLHVQPGLMAPPPRSSLPNRGPPSSLSSSLVPPPSHTAIPTKPRKKVLLTPGHSPLDWARLASSPTANLRGLPPNAPYLRVPPSLLKQYSGRKGKDSWTVLGGKVYNMTPYLPYHPGGEPELMKAAGRDGTKLFGEVHPWVNWEGMLESCLVGIAVEEGEFKATGTLEEMD
ncbi:hypothetical protein QTJ16_007034 [Diplocarpon rosae]|uniref:Cytochrome b5 heme-binding domain-containing protein n=1 Tax=Diplocarpon rosae TaxID=946125 RepID=A0AAD9WB22_9HELO|nr:hypothetical protein QTJ16_007034 [Diplocarpon rosae]PBP26293.1 putative heme/steroid binding protein [Diplocarpon rosae]